MIGALFWDPRLGLVRLETVQLLEIMLHGDGLVLALARSESGLLRQAVVIVVSHQALDLNC